jgi:hypothetical protein
MQLINPIQTHQAVKKCLWALPDPDHKEVLDALKIYRRARILSWWRKLWARIRGRDNRLLKLDFVTKGKCVRGWRYAGLQTINIDHIIGSEGHWDQFDNGFYPTHSSDKTHWLSVAMKLRMDLMPKPVELVEIGSNYFVQSGIYQVSVARALGLKTVRAYVILWEITEKPEYSWMKDQIPISVKQSAEKFGWDKITRTQDDQVRTTKGVSSRVRSIQPESPSSIL